MFTRAGFYIRETYDAHVQLDGPFVVPAIRRLNKLRESRDARGVNDAATRTKPRQIATITVAACCDGRVGLSAASARCFEICGFVRSP